MAELASHYPRSYHVLSQPRRRASRIPTKRAGCLQRAERMRYLLLGDFNGHADAEQALCDVQECLPLGLLIPLVQE